MRFRFLLVLATLCASLFGVPQVPENQKATTGATAQHSGNTSRLIPPTHVVIDPPFPTLNSPPAAAEGQDAATEQPLPRFGRPEWVIVYITALYVVFTILIWVAMKRQVARMDLQRIESNKANADTLAALNRQAAVMEQQIRLQEASMTQWVSILKWRVDIQERTSPLSPEPRTLRVQFDIMNESNYPLTINALIGFFGRLPNARRLEIMGDALLFPRRPYTCEGVLNVTEEQAKQYAEGALRIAVHGVISHVGISKQRSPLMAIHGNLVCGEDIRAWLQYESFSMVEEEEEGGEEAT